MYTQSTVVLHKLHQTIDFLKHPSLKAALKLFVISGDEIKLVLVSAGGWATGMLNVKCNSDYIVFIMTSHCTGTVQMSYVTVPTLK